MEPARLCQVGPAVVMAVGLLMSSTAAATAHESPPKVESGAADHMPAESMPMTGRMRMPEMNPARGRILFVSKGCVACHSINGVGGHDATPLDAHTMAPAMNPFDFAAKMWRMAPAMILAQEEALGEQIEFTGDELADIIAFVHNDREQHLLTEADITPRIRKLMGHSHAQPEAGGAAHGHMPAAGHGHGDVEAPRPSEDH